MKTNTYKDNIKKIVEINNKKRQASLIELLTKTAFTDGQLDILRTVHLKRP